MMTNSLAQIAGELPRQATPGGDEWAEGYRMRVGIVHVDHATQRRTLKSSGRWYSNLMRAHRSAGGPT